MTNPSNRAYGGGLPIAADMIPPVNPFLGLLPRKYWTKEKAFFTYTIGFFTGSPNQVGALGSGAGTNASGSTNIQGDADFCCIALAGLVIQTDNITAIAVPAILCQLFDSGSSQGLSDFPIRYEDLFGTAQNPAYLPFPRVFRRNGSINATLTNQQALAKNVYLAFIGFKIYPDEAGDTPG